MFLQIIKMRLKPKSDDLISTAIISNMLTSFSERTISINDQHQIKQINDLVFDKICVYVFVVIPGL